MKPLSLVRVSSRILFSLLVIYTLGCASVLGQSAVPYRGPNLGVEQRVADLLSRMTLEEKVAQLQGAWQNRQFPQNFQLFFVDEKGSFVPVSAERSSWVARPTAKS